MLNSTHLCFCQVKRQCHRLWRGDVRIVYDYLFPNAEVKGGFLANPPSCPSPYNGIY